MIRLALLGSVLLTGCTLPQVVPEAAGDYVPSGEVLFSTGLSASFDGARVRSPEMNLARRSDGSWGGNFQGEPFDVTVTDTAARGVGLTLVRDLDDQGVTHIEGQWQGRRVRYALGGTKVSIHARNLSFDFDREGNSAAGRQGELKLEGQAGLSPPPWPQTAFALLALFN